MAAQASGDPALSWEDGAHCPAPARLAESVHALLGKDLHDDVSLALRVRVLAAEGGVELSLSARARSEQFRRVLVTDSCAAAQDAALLLVSLALAPVSDAEPESPPEEAHDPPPEPRNPQRIAAGLALGALGDLGTLPGVSGGFSLGGFLRRERLQLWLTAHTLIAREAADRDSGARARVDLWAGSLGAALMLGQGWFRAGPSAAIELGYLRAQGSGTDDPRTTGTLWAAGYLGALLELPAGTRTSLRGQLEGGAPFRRPSVAVQNGPNLYEPWPLVLRLTFSVAIRLGPKA